jgi:hypothetical protein
VREHQCADERDHLSGALTAPQQHRADCASIANGRRDLRPGRLLSPRPSHRERSCGATLAIYEYYGSARAVITKAPLRCRGACVPGQLVPLDALFEAQHDAEPTATGHRAPRR